MAGARHWEQDKEATVYIGNLDERVSDSLVWELMLQAGRIVNVHLPKDRVSQAHQGYGFVEFISEEDADYAAKVMNQIRLFGKPIRVNKASADKQKTVEVGAELFVGNLDGMVVEQTLYETFNRFGGLLTVPKIARDDSGMSKGYGFISFSNFEASDEAIANLNGQYLMNKQIAVQYAYKKDGKGERHGDDAERMLATEGKKNITTPIIPAIPAQMFAQQAAIPSPMTPNPNAGVYANTRPPPPPMGFNTGPPQMMGRPPAPPPSLQGPSLSGLPPRPPPSQAGYGGPQQFMPPGFNGLPGPPPGLPPNFQSR